jgi:hypothetical protein
VTPARRAATVSATRDAFIIPRMVS